MNQKNFIARSPIFVNWNYTNKCNFNCKHCYSRNEQNLAELSTSEYFFIAKQLIKHQVFQVNLGGGEPLLREDYLQIIKYMSENGIKVNLSTNGWFINNEIAADLKSVGINFVFLSLDHFIASKHDNFRDQPGSFEKVINCIELLAKHNIKVKLSTVLTKLNIDSLDEIISLANNLSVFGIDFKRFKPEGNGLLYRDQFELTLQQEELMYSKIRKLKTSSGLVLNLVYSEKPIEDIDEGCPCGKKSIAIRPNGDISPCVYNSLKIGNILQDDLSDLWLNSPSLKYLRCNFSCLGLNQ